MILFVVLHLLRIFFQAAYKYPRELTWLVGVGLLASPSASGSPATCCPGTSGRSGRPRSAPRSPGPSRSSATRCSALLRGGADVTGATLSRFFGIHVLVLPISLAALLAGAPGPRPPAGPGEPEAARPRTGQARWPSEPARAVLPGLRPRRDDRLVILSRSSSSWRPSSRPAWRTRRTPSRPRPTSSRSGTSSPSTSC